MPRRSSVGGESVACGAQVFQGSLEQTVFEGLAAGDPLSWPPIGRIGILTSLGHWRGTVKISKEQGKGPGENAINYWDWVFEPERTILRKKVATSCDVVYGACYSMRSIIWSQ